jgi:hypothetical protein
MSNLPSRKSRLVEDECPHVLIVEGYSDLLFCAAFLDHLRLSSGVFIKSFDGKPNIRNRDRLSDFITPARLAKKQSIGILIDADDQPDGTAQSVAAHLQAITGRDVTEGTWQEERGSAKLGFMVLPDALTKGEIETLVWNSLPDTPQNTGMKAAVSDYLTRMESLGWKPQWPGDKARIGAYLAAAYDEDPRLGPGAREKKFDFNAPGLARLRSFLQALPSAS